MLNSKGTIFSFILHDKNLDQPEQIEEYLRDANINWQESLNNLKIKLRLDIRNELYRRGQELKNSYKNLLEQPGDPKEPMADNLLYAFRKLDKIDESDINDLINDQQKLDIIKKLVNKKENEK